MTTYLVSPDEPRLIVNCYRKLSCHTYTSCATQVMNGTEVSSSAVPASQSRLVDFVISSTMPPLGVTVHHRSSGDSPGYQEVKR
eukprot:scaffold2378_cov137-Skeletonema_dohrnii-CCMP3373.AAC.10